MFSARLIVRIVILLASFSMAGCSGVTDDLLPSGDDKREDVVGGSMGTQVSQQSPDFSVLDTLGNSRGHYDELSQPGVTGVVLYFTMWCPICEVHMSDMRANVMPNFPNVKFFLVDYVSGSVAGSLASQQAYGYTGIDTLADTDQSVLDLYQATMGTTVVINSVGNIVEMNEDYKDGVKLTETLQALP
jgi:peroxiredoxin